MPSDVRISLSLTSKYTHAPFSSQPRDAEPGDGRRGGRRRGGGGGAHGDAAREEGFGSTLPLAPRATATTGSQRSANRATVIYFQEGDEWSSAAVGSSASQRLKSLNPQRIPS